MFLPDNLAFVSPQLQACNSYLISFQTAACPAGQEALRLGAGQSGGRSASVSATRGSRHCQHGCAQPQRDPPRSALISRGKRFPGRGWPPPPLPLPPASPAAGSPAQVGGKRLQRRPHPRASRAGRRAPAPAAPGSELPAPTKPPLRFSLLTSPLRSARPRPLRSSRE